MQQNMMGQNIIITEPSRNLRALGRNALAGKRKLGMLAMLIYMMSLMAPVMILNEIFGTSISDSLTVDITAGSAAVPVVESFWLSDVYTILVTGALELGISLFFLALFRKQMVRALDVFLGFEYFGKALGLMLFQSLFIVLWTLALIVPGIIAGIRYSQAFFILADDPSKGIRQCMNESKMMMRGNKWKYFCLTFSFIGWILLTVVCLVAYMTMVYVIIWSIPGLIAVLIMLLAYVLTIPLSVYMYATYAGFYEILAGHLIKETAPAPVTPEMVPGLEADKADSSDDFFIPKEM